MTGSKCLQLAAYSLQSAQADSITAEGFSVDSEDSDDDWWSVSESSGKMESPPSRIALDYLTMELHAETSARLALYS